MYEDEYVYMYVSVDMQKINVHTDVSWHEIKALHVTCNLRLCYIFTLT